jgi:hypothetical protein
LAINNVFGEDNLTNITVEELYDLSCELLTSTIKYLKKFLSFIDPVKFTIKEEMKV